jgi:hypothetical protein
MVENSWQHTQISADGTHHLSNSLPLYVRRFSKVLAYHAPGLAPVFDSTGAYHINVEGEPVYTRRFLQTFGYYYERAAVESEQGWFHIDVHGKPISSSCYAWCGNFQENVCTVKDITTGRYYHIDSNGHRLYPEDYCYAGDYREGAAVVTTDTGLQTHISHTGSLVHDRYFFNLSVFHKNIACAKDESGWFHIDRAGVPLYAARYKTIEPYYNNVAVAEGFDDGLFTIDLAGEVIQVIRPASRDLFHETSAELVGFWKTQTIHAAVKLRIFDHLPDITKNITDKVNLEFTVCRRFMSALQELGLVNLEGNDRWHLTAKGVLFHPIDTSPMAAAALIWGDAHYQAWKNLAYLLQNPQARDEQHFEKLAHDATALQAYHKALSGYAAHDYRKILETIDWAGHKNVIDAGGGIGTLLHMVLNHYPHLNGFLLEMPAVIGLIAHQDRLKNCNYYAADLKTDWQCQADAILLARVLHDWPDDQALVILKNAKNSLSKTGKIYVLEMILPVEEGKGRLLDINMLVMTNGRERALTDWEQLVQAAELRIVRTVTLTPIVSLIEIMGD